MVKYIIKGDVEIVQQKLEQLYNQCLAELKSIGFNLNKEIIGEITIQLSKRNNKRYGCCKQENPDEKYKVIKKVGRKKYIQYEKFNKHTIEVSKWVMDLDEKVIKNTIMHEIIHCFPYCNNHGPQFKKYANFINIKLGYNISRLGNKEKDFQNSNIQYTKEEYKYTIKCKKCGKQFHRNRLQKNFFVKYRCMCGGKLEKM